MRVCSKLLFLGVAVWLVPGCSVLTPKKDPTRFYELTALTEVPATGAPPAESTVVLTVEVAGYLQNNSLAQRIAPNQLAYFPFDQWAQPFGEGVDQTVRNDLSLLTRGSVLRANQSYVTRDATRLDVRVWRFDVMPQSQVQVTASWQIRTTQSGAVVRQGRFSQNRPYSADPTSLQPAVAAMNQLLHELSRAIAADLPK
ncbi:MAG TPA: PqiC family protein [Verrucomicrobiota bacterium]|nr:hypothetical protein [Verrucomicrobiales bacterium]HRI15174.1 PqiC family protein [Verrucomicrobiota bacterium]